MQADAGQANTVEPGGWREVWRLALPLILSNSVWTLQITIDRVMLAHWDADAVGAAMAAVLLFWTPLALLQTTAAYATTFVAQYYGAGRYHRIGPAVWQALYFSVVAGLGFLLLVPLASSVIAIGDHSPSMQEMETDYFICLCFSALPTLITHSASSFFTGLGLSWTVLLINTCGLATNAVLDYAWIFGNLGFPEKGIAGAGWATVVGMWVSALVALLLMFRRAYREKYATLSGWRFEWDLSKRLMRFGLPSGVQWALDALAFTIFTFLVGRMGDAALTASSITFTLNMLAILPAFGLAQAVSVLVGQRLGEDRPDLAERSTWSGFQIAWLYMAAVALLYAFLPHVFLQVFQGGGDTEKWHEAAALVPTLLKFVAVYTLFDSMNLIFSFALKGAGDTRFVTIAALLLSWPIMVVPSWAAWEFDWGLMPAWAFASAYVIALAFLFLWRFRGGKWKSMRVIEPVVVERA